METELLDAGRGAEAAYAELPDREQDTDGLSLLLQERQYEHVANLDSFLGRLYSFWTERGFVCTVLSRLLNLATLAFTIAFSGFLLLCVDWSALTTKCRAHARECDVASVGIREHPLADVGQLYAIAVCTYLAVLSFSWLFLSIRFVAEVPTLLDMRLFCASKLGLGDDDMRTVTWPAVVSRLVATQTSTRLSLVRDMTALDVAARILRRENYLMGAINQGALRLTLPWLRGALGQQCWLTTGVQWSLYWAVLNPLFDDHSRLRPLSADKLATRCRLIAIAQLLLTPFIAVYMGLYYFMRNAERVYHHPSAVGARRWSGEARWRMRHYNEYPHVLEARLSAAKPAATAYCACFPNHVVSLCARFVAFVVGALAAALLALAAVDERLLEAVLWGRNLLWYTAVCGTLLAASRALIADDAPGSVRPDPVASLAACVAHTHFMPRRWRNASGNSRLVYGEFTALFPSALGALLEELASLLVAPALLWWSLPACAQELTSFLRDYTVHADGVGDICSLAAFDFERHGSSDYGANGDASQRLRSRHGALEKSFISFQAQHPDWEPGVRGKALLDTLAQHEARQSAIWAASTQHAGASVEAAMDVDARCQALLQSLHEEQIDGTN